MCVCVCVCVCVDMESIVPAWIELNGKKTKPEKKFEQSLVDQNEPI